MFPLVSLYNDARKQLKMFFTKIEAGSFKRFNKLADFVSSAFSSSPNGACVYESLFFFESDLIRSWKQTTFCGGQCLKRRFGILFSENASSSVSAIR
jgi:hypothetical protein